MKVLKQQQISIKIKAQGGRPGEYVSSTVPARVLVKGIFALNRPTYFNANGHLGQNEKVWVLTHIPTGLCIMREILTIKQGVSIAKSLLDKGIDWTFTDIQDVPVNLRKQAKDVVQKLKGVYGLPEYG